MRSRSTSTLLRLTLVMGSLGGACSKGGGSQAGDAGADSAEGDAAKLCPAFDGALPEIDAADLSVADEFGPNAPAAKATSSLGRVNIYEVTSPVLLQRIDLYLGADLADTDVTIAVHEATSKTSPFQKVTDIQVKVAACQGWTTSGDLALPLVVGHFYALGYDPNQPVTAFVSTDADVVPIDGAFGRLIGSRTTTSVSVTNLTWDKVTDKEFNRQRLLTSPRAPDPVDAGAGGAGGGAKGAGGGGGAGGTSDGGTAGARG